MVPVGPWCSGVTTAVGRPHRELGRPKGEGPAGGQEEEGDRPG